VENTLQDAMKAQPSFLQQ